jgi:hypothetical protein
MPSSSTKKRNRDASGDKHVVYSDGKSTFWEVDRVIGRRVEKRKVEYLIKWKGYPKSEATWEPENNLCAKTAHEAKQFDLKSAKSSKQRDKPEDYVTPKGTARKKKEKHKVVYVVDNPKEAEKLSEAKEPPADSHDNEQDSSNSVPESRSEPPIETEFIEMHSNVNTDTRSQPLPKSAPPLVLQDGRWYWTDEEQIKYREVERIDVHDIDARQRTTDARLNGTPIVLVGHAGWANFARKWLYPVDPDEMQFGEQTGLSEFIDLSRNYALDIERMIDDIGDEIVPVVRLNYDEHNPLHAKMKLSTFLRTHWSHPDGYYHPTDEMLYLHQWQFPLSETAGEKLCYNSNPLPNDIFGGDLLKYWLDLQQCKGDNPLQYLFMGRSGTQSRLHRDKGGLEITIAPIIGEKECILVHRSDGATCFYHLDASIDEIDLHKYPLMAQARVWKTIVKPGEILLMPQGTYHQCRNLTACLSYSRFHLDTVNLLPFLQSMFDGDAEETDHGEVIWNAAFEIMKVIDEFTDKCKECITSSPPQRPPTLSDELAAQVDCLRSLRNICREIERKAEAQALAKGWDLASPRVRNKKVKLGKEVFSLGIYDRLVNDIDESLHYFQHREHNTTPPRQPRVASFCVAAPSSEEILAVCKRQRYYFDSEEKSSDDNEEEPSENHVYKNLEQALASSFSHSYLCDHVKSRPTEFDDFTFSNVIVRQFDRDVLGTVLKVEDQMNAAYLSYEGYPKSHDEYQPFERLRVSVGGESSVEISPSDVKVGAIVLNRWGDSGEVSSRI